MQYLIQFALKPIIEGPKMIYDPKVLTDLPIRIGDRHVCAAIKVLCETFQKVTVIDPQETMDISTDRAYLTRPNSIDEAHLLTFCRSLANIISSNGAIIKEKVTSKQFLQESAQEYFSALREVIDTRNFFARVLKGRSKAYKEGYIVIYEM